jgi:hypothetical protein
MKEQEVKRKAFEEAEKKPIITIVVQKKGDTYRATLKGKEDFASGSTFHAAIGSLVNQRRLLFGVHIESQPPVDF